MATTSKQDSPTSSLMSELPIDRLKDEAIGLGKALAQRGIARLGESMSGATGKLGDLADAAPGPGDVVKAAGKVASPMGAVKGAASKVADVLPGGSDDDSSSADDSSSGKSASGDGTDLKVTNIVESIDVPVSRDVAYGLWTQFEEFPSFMKKVETVQQSDPEVVTWKAQVFLSHRTWTSRIVDQVPPEHIVWKSEADKGRVDGAVTFHELAPDLTRVLVTLEYHPQGLFERVGNLWHAQGRRVRLELKHFRRHVANHALMNQGEVDGWEGEIHDGKVKPRRRTSSTAKKSTSGSSNGGGSNGGGSTAKKSAAKKSTAKKSTGATPRKSAAKKSTASKSTAKKAPASKSTAKKSPARKSTAKKSASKRTSAASKRTSSTSARASSSNRGSTAKKTARASSKSRSTRSRS